MSMAFAKYLEENKEDTYEGKYIKYSTLIENIDEDTESKIKEEFTRVFEFIQSETERFKIALSEASGEGKSKLEFVKLQNEMKKFAEFIRINVVGFKKVLKHFDKKMGQNLCDKFKKVLSEKLEQIEHLDELIYKGSKEKLKLSQADTKAKGPNNSFVRKTNKYWVHMDNLMALKLAIVRHLPLYVFSNIPGSSPYSAWNHKTHDTCVSSVYFDNDENELYTGRMHKEEGAEAIRIRWYGTTEQNDSNKVEDIVFIERKKHCESWTGEKSKKLRFKLNEKYVNDFIAGKDVWKHAEKLNGADVKWLYDEIQEAIQTQNLKPSVRTFYKRVAFQLPNDASVRISLDTNLCMILENDPSNWRRRDVGCDWPFRALDEKNIVRFPHAILEVKTQGVDETKPAWIEEIINSAYVEHVHKFSKFLHGTAILKTVDEIPYWLPQMRTDIRKDPFYNVKRKKEFYKNALVSKSSEEKITISNHTNSLVDNNIIENDNLRIAIPVRVEPKVFFANERTFLSWVQFAIFLGGIGTAMLGLVNYHANVCGAIMIVVAIIFAIYALHLFYWRATRIRMRDAGPYDDTTGPMVLVGVFIVALLFSVYFKFPMKKKLAIDNN